MIYRNVVDFALKSAELRSPKCLACDTAAAMPHRLWCAPCDISLADNRELMLPHFIRAMNGASPSESADHEDRRCDMCGKRSYMVPCDTCAGQLEDEA